jgi:hypothetical protein
MNVNQPQNERQDIQLTVETTRGPKPISVEKTTKISEIIKIVAQMAGFGSGDRFELFLKTDLQHPLQPERTVESYHFTSGTTLVLSQIGSGV